MISLSEAKLYLKVECDDEDALIRQLIQSSQHLCLDILRKTSDSLSDEEQEVLKTAILYGLAYLYEHREHAHHKELKETLYHLLLFNRKEVF